MDVLDKYCKIAQEIVDSEKLATTLQMTLLLFNRVLLGDDEEEAKGLHGFPCSRLGAGFHRSFLVSSL